MDSIEQVGENERWTTAEKKVARRAFDQALERHLSAIIAEAKRMMANVANPSDLWRVEAYLTESRQTVDRIYQFRHSDLLRVFSPLMRDEWLSEADLVGCNPRRLPTLNEAQKACAECSANRPKVPHRCSGIQLSQGFDSDSIIHGCAESLRKSVLRSLCKYAMYSMPIFCLNLIPACFSMFFNVPIGISRTVCGTAALVVKSL